MLVKWRLWVIVWRFSCPVDLARSGSGFTGVVSFHGLLMGSDIAEGGVKSKVLVLHERDPMVPLEMVDEFQKK